MNYKEIINTKIKERITKIAIQEKYNISKMTNVSIVLNESLNKG